LSSGASIRGDDITLASGNNFINNAGSSVFTLGTGRWLVWSKAPGNDTLGGLVGTFSPQYSSTFGTTTPPATGNGFLYSSAAPATPLTTIQAAQENSVKYVVAAIVTSPISPVLSPISVTNLTNLETEENALVKDITSTETIDTAVTATTTATTTTTTDATATTDTDESTSPATGKMGTTTGATEKADAARQAEIDEKKAAAKTAQDDAIKALVHEMDTGHDQSATMAASEKAQDAAAAVALAELPPGASAEEKTNAVEKAKNDAERLADIAAKKAAADAALEQAKKAIKDSKAQGNDEPESEGIVENQSTETDGQKYESEKAKKDDKDKKDIKDDKDRKDEKNKKEGSNKKGEKIKVDSAEVEKAIKKAEDTAVEFALSKLPLGASEEDRQKAENNAKNAVRKQLEVE
jgi:hypothetical protein